MNKKKILKWLEKRINELHKEASRYWSAGQDSFRYSAEGMEEILIKLKHKIEEGKFD
jgi:hypothetical protein